MSINKNKILEIKNLTKLYKNNRGINNLSININQGEIYGLLGPNGSGKTTTMKACANLIAPDSGDIKIFGENPETNIEKALEKVACLIEAPSFYPYLSAKQNLEIIKELYPDCDKSRIEQVLEQVGLLSFCNEKVSKFSLGMKQRLGIAMTLISEPELLILDEPSNGLDIEGMADVRKIILDQAAIGKTILISSHLANELEKICTHVAIIREGVLLGTAIVSELMKDFGSIENYYMQAIGKTESVIA